MKASIKYYHEIEHKKYTYLPRWFSPLAQCLTPFALTHITISSHVQVYWYFPTLSFLRNIQQNFAHLRKKTWIWLYKEKYK